MSSVSLKVKHRKLGTEVIPVDYCCYMLAYIVEHSIKLTNETDIARIELYRMELIIINKFGCCKIDNGKADDLRRHCAHYDVTVMGLTFCTVHVEWVT